MTWQEEQTWLSGLRVADAVAIWSERRVQRLDIVERVTPAQVIVGGRRFWKRSGLAVGEPSWSYTKLVSPERHSK